MSGSTSRSCVVLGATGLVGGQLVELLAEQRGFEPIVLLVRRLPEFLVPVGVEVRVGGFAQPVPEAFQGAGTVFSALGTTIARAGSRPAFAAVDRDLVVALGRQARAQGVTTWIAVSATGADPSSRIFYNRIKGEAEQALRSLDFPRMALLRPSLLLGHRDERRPGEAVAQALLGPLSPVIPASVRPVQARTVARVMLQVARDPAWQGVRVVGNAELHHLAKREPATKKKP